MMNQRLLALTALSLGISSPAMADAVFSDGFANNPFTGGTPRWSQTFPDGSYDLQWTGSSNPNGLSAALPVNATTDNVYSFSTGARTMSTTDTSVPAGVAGWTTMTYAVDFQMGGTGGVDNNYIDMLVNRSGNNGYTAGIFTGGDGSILWQGDLAANWSGFKVQADTWYTFKTTVTKSGSNIAMYSQILNPTNSSVLATSATFTATGAAYTNPNGFKMTLANNDGYWDHASQVDNFLMTATAVPEPVGLVLLGLGAAALLRRRR